MEAISFGAACRMLANLSGPDIFLEQVQYSGRRLAKLGMSPRRAIDALHLYHEAAFWPLDGPDYVWARELVETATALALNNAFYDVRESETEAFYELFRSELESRSVRELLQRSLEILVKVFHAGAGHIFLLNSESAAWECEAAVPESMVRAVPASAGLASAMARPRCLSKMSRAVLDPGWECRFQTFWSVPLSISGRVAGVLQLAFARFYPWLPRERDLLVVAGERCLSGVEKAKLTENLARSEEEVRHLATRLLQVEEMERRRISRELHDEAGQSLLCIRLRLEMLERAATPESRAGIAAVRAQVERTIDEVRRLIGALSPNVLDRFGLEAALRQVAATLRKLHGLSIRLEAAVAETLPERVQLVAYRLVQECCNNIVKHASAREVKISVRSTDKCLRLDIQDDGVGFNVAEALSKRSSFGITGMKERVALLGGKFQIRSAGPETSARKGTRVQIELPITDETYGQDTHNARG